MVPSASGVAFKCAHVRSCECKSVGGSDERSGGTANRAAVLSRSERYRRWHGLCAQIAERTQPKLCPPAAPQHTTTRRLVHGGFGRAAVLMVKHTELVVHDAHTHLSGSESGESADNIIACLDGSGVQSAFVIAPLLDKKSWQITEDDLADLRAHNDYVADVCSRYPERLLGFAVLNPAPGLGGGSLPRAVDLMIEEARRCYNDLGLRGIKMIPAGWYPNEAPLLKLYRELESLGAYVLFHTGIFLDGAEGMYCRPAFFEALRQTPRLRAQLAHLGWPWLDEAIGVMEMETEIHDHKPESWQFRVDLSFGPPDDWQLETFEKALDSLPHQMLCYGADVFWPSDAEQYLEQYLQPQLALFEVAVTNGHLMSEGSPHRKEARQHIFGQNALDHWRAAVRSPQQPRRADHKIITPHAIRGKPSPP